MQCYSTKHDIWYLDSGCNNHMTSNLDSGCIKHFIFGHLNFGGLNQLHTKNMMKVFPLIDKPERVCEGCIFSKQHRETFPVKNLYRPHTPFDIVHSDICVQLQTSSMGGCN